MKIDLNVSGKVISGTDRGGEDLFLRFQADIPLDHPMIVQVIKAVEPTQIGPAISHELAHIWHQKGQISVVFIEPLECSDDFLDRNDLDDYDEENDEALAARFTSNHYDFVWEGSQQDALVLIKDEFLKTENWSIKFRTWTGRDYKDNHVLRFEYEHYVAGNAD